MELRNERSYVCSRKKHETPTSTIILPAACASVDALVCKFSREKKACLDKPKSVAGALPLICYIFTFLFYVYPGSGGSLSFPNFPTQGATGPARESGREAREREVPGFPVMCVHLLPFVAASYISLIGVAVALLSSSWVSSSMHCGCVDVGS